MEQECSADLGHLTQATFKTRHSRFLVEVELGGRSVQAHLPNTGRLDYALLPGKSVWLRRRVGERRTEYDLVLVEGESGRLVVDSSIQNMVVERAVLCGQIKEFRGYKVCGREVGSQNSRIDFLLCGENGKCFLEVKGVTLIRDGWALYPDAPTRRGLKHLDTLIWLAGRGFRASIFFLALGEGALRFKPNSQVDPAFSRRLSEAHKKGVEVYAYRIAFEDLKVKLGERIEAFLS